MLHQQQESNSSYPTEYRVKIFSPEYMDVRSRSAVQSIEERTTLSYSQTVSAVVTELENVTAARSIHPGFRTHGVAMGQRSIELEVRVGDDDERWEMGSTLR